MNKATSINGKQIKTKTFGTLYIDDIGTDITAPYKSCQRLMLGNTFPGKEILWVVVQDPANPDSEILVADRPLICGIPWCILQSFDFVHGRPVCIDGQLYWCRSLRAPAKGHHDNEWEKVLKDSAEFSDLVWHWRKTWSWSQSPYQHFDGTYSDTIKTAFGGINYDFIGEFSHDVVYDKIGFRPILELLSQPSAAINEFVGQELCIYGPAGRFSGVLTEVTDYDLVIHGTRFDGDSSWAVIEPSMDVVIDRSKIIYWGLSKELTAKYGLQ